MTIRPAVPADAPAIARIHVASWQAAYAGLVPQPYLDSLDVAGFTDRWQIWLTTPGDRLAFGVAEQADGLVGFVSGGPIREPLSPFNAELYAIYLLPAVQRHGIGRDLFRYITDRLTSFNLHDLLLWCLRDNPSNGFYERLGGQPIAEGVLDIGGLPLATRAYGWPALSV